VLDTGIESHCYHDGHCGILGGPKNCTPTVSQQIVLHCVPINIRFECDTRSNAQAHNIFDCYILSVKYSIHGVIRDAKLIHWYSQRR